MKNPLTSRTSAVALAAVMTAALGACSKSEQEQTRQQVDRAANSAAEAGRELKQDAAKLGQDLKQKADEVGRAAAAAGRELKADAADATREIRADAARAGAAVKDGMGQAAAKLDDVGITAGVNARLAQDSELSALRINVDTVGGQVSLNGPAPNQAAKDRATALARASEGVKGVTNNLTLQ